MHNGIDPARRRFVQGLVFGGAAASLGLWRSSAWALGPDHYPAVLSGRQFDLTIGETPVNFTGARRMATTINGGIPGPILRWREGDEVTLRVTNRLPEASSIHWHGILLPANMDGVPGLSFSGIAPGETYTYRFRVKQSGTYWYHSHSGFQEQTGVYGPLIIEPREPEHFSYDREHVVLLSDWSDEDPHRIFAKLKKMSDYYNFDRQTVGDFFADVREDGLQATLDNRARWGRMRMLPTDLADVSAHTYTYLVNGTTPAGNWTGLFRRGERLRLRVINGSAMSFFDLRIPGLKMTVVAADGQPVHPVTVDEFRIGVAETYDVLVEPDQDEPYTIFAQSADRSGYARATLSPRPGLSAAVPPLDPRPLLTMADMGHGGHGAAMDASGSHSHGMDHGHSMPEPVAGHGGHGMAAMLSHPHSEAGNPGVDMQTMMPQHRLDDPGIGLRDNGRRVLTYADLKSTFTSPDPREPSRTLQLHLTGHMERYIWSFDGIRFADSRPLRLKYGERLRIELVNDTMMEHPIHLHGLWSDLEDAHGNVAVRKHTVNLPPGTRRSYRVTADALGRWAYHCHLLYHMEAGMFREVRVEA